MSMEQEGLLGYFVLVSIYITSAAPLPGVHHHQLLSTVASRAAREIFTGYLVHPAVVSVPAWNTNELFCIVSLLTKSVSIIQKRVTVVSGTIWTYLVLTIKSTFFNQNGLLWSS